MRYLVLSVSGGYWYRSEDVPCGAQDLYCPLLACVVEVCQKQQVSMPSQEDCDWLVGEPVQ